MKVATAEGSAKATDDYTAKPTRSPFCADEMSKTVTVDVNGDRGLECEDVSCGNPPDASGAFATSSQGT
jgi:hypothetical protein